MMVILNRKLDFSREAHFQGGIKLKSKLKCVRFHVAAKHTLQSSVTRCNKPSLVLIYSILLCSVVLRSIQLERTSGEQALFCDAVPIWCLLRKLTRKIRFQLLILSLEHRYLFYTTHKWRITN